MFSKYKHSVQLCVYLPLDRSGQWLPFRPMIWSVSAPWLSSEDFSRACTRTWVACSSLRVQHEEYICWCLVSRPERERREVWCARMRSMAASGAAGRMASFRNCQSIGETGRQRWNQPQNLITSRILGAKWFSVSLKWGNRCKFIIWMSLAQMKSTDPHKIIVGRVHWRNESWDERVASLGHGWVPLLLRHKWWILGPVDHDYIF